jgi:hypothetical protein
MNMADNDKPPVPPVGEKTSAPVSPTLLPTVRDHAERLQLKPWQVGAVVARLNGEHDEEGVRVFPEGVSLTTRMTDEEFDAAADVALHGRV